MHIMYVRQSSRFKLAKGVERTTVENFQVIPIVEIL